MKVVLIWVFVQLCSFVQWSVSFFTMSLCNMCIEIHKITYGCNGYNVEFFICMFVLFVAGCYYCHMLQSIS